VSAIIPTNVIFDHRRRSSLKRIVLPGLRPRERRSVGVPRGSAAQVKAMKQVAVRSRVSWRSYREMAAFCAVGSDLECSDTASCSTVGARLTELLNAAQFRRSRRKKQVAVIFGRRHGYLRQGRRSKQLARFEQGLLVNMRSEGRMCSKPSARKASQRRHQGRI